MQLAAVYLIRLFAAVSHFIIPIGQKKQLIGFHYGNHMRDKICVARKINGVALLYIYHTVAVTMYTMFIVSRYHVICKILLVFSKQQDCLKCC